MRKSRLGKSGIGLGDEEASLATHHDIGLFPLTSAWCSGRMDFIALLLAVSVTAWFWVPLVKLFTLASEDEHFSHLLLVPILAFYLLFVNRVAILASRRESPFIGLLVMAGGAVCYWLAAGQHWTQDRLAVEMLAFIVTCWGLFLFCFGGESFRKRSSADTVDVLFSTLGIHTVREGFTFELSNFIIFIEGECSGIRSFFALIITSLVAGYWCLESWWARATLVAVVLPLAIIKNAFRIIGLTLLANNLDPAFLIDSALHRNSGIPLFIMSLAILFSLTCLLRQLERRFKHNLEAGNHTQA
jgi:exosortase/archaeosortase family protein